MSHGKASHKKRPAGTYSAKGKTGNWDKFHCANCHKEYRANASQNNLTHCNGKQCKGQVKISFGQGNSTLNDRQVANLTANLLSVGTGKTRTRKRTGSSAAGPGDGGGGNNSSDSDVSGSDDGDGGSDGGRHDGGDSDSDNSQNGAAMAEVPAPSLVLEEWARLWGEKGDRPYRELIRSRKLYYEFDEPMLGPSGSRSTEDERKVHLRGCKIFFFKPEELSGVMPMCPVCGDREVNFKTIGSTGATLRHCIPGDFVAVSQYKFKDACVRGGCPDAWKGGGGGGNKTLWSYQPELYNQQPDSTRMLLERWLLIGGQGTAVRSEFHDMFQYCHANGVANDDMHGILKAINGKRFDRNFIACRAFKVERAAAGVQQGLVQVEQHVVEQPSPHVGYKTVGPE